MVHCPACMNWLSNNQHVSISSGCGYRLLDLTNVDLTKCILRVWDGFCFYSLPTPWRVKPTQMRKAWSQIKCTTKTQSHTHIQKESISGHSRHTFVDAEAGFFSSTVPQETIILCCMLTNTPLKGPWLIKLFTISLSDREMIKQLTVQQLMPSLPWH